MKFEELEVVGGYDIRNRNIKQGPKFVKVMKSNNQEIKYHRICMPIYHMLSSNRACIYFIFYSTMYDFI